MGRRWNDGPMNKSRQMDAYYANYIVRLLKLDINTKFALWYKTIITQPIWLVGL